MSTPTNKALYDKVKASVKKKYKWPSAYGSAALVKQYKAKGGTFSGKKPKKGPLASSISSLKSSSAPA